MRRDFISVHQLADESRPHDLFLEEIAVRSRCAFCKPPQPRPLVQQPRHCQRYQGSYHSGALDQNVDVANQRLRPRWERCPCRSRNRIFLISSTSRQAPSMIRRDHPRLSADIGHVLAPECGVHRSMGNDDPQCRRALADVDCSLNAAARFSSERLDSDGRSDEAYSVKERHIRNVIALNRPMQSGDGACYRVMCEQNPPTTSPQEVFQWFH